MAPGHLFMIVRAVKVMGAEGIDSRFIVRFFMADRALAVTYGLERFMAPGAFAFECGVAGRERADHKAAVLKERVDKKERRDKCATQEPDLHHAGPGKRID